MKSTLVWFSGAGNSKTIAKDIAKEITYDQVLAVNDVIKTPELLKDTTTLALVFPIYFFGPPALIRHFMVETLAKAHLELDYLCVVFTHGGMPFYGPTITDRLLADAGYAASYVRGISMVDTYIPLFRIPSEKTQARKHTRITNQLPVIIDELKQQSLRVATRLPMARFFHTLWEQGLKNRGSKDRNFVVTDACTSCGICAKVCPANNITLESGKVHFHNRCEQCFACFHHCPEHAIVLKRKPLLGYSWYTPPKTFITKD